MRAPSIHITESRLKLLIDQYVNTHEIGIDTDNLVKYLMKTGVIYSLSNRNILETGVRLKKTTQRIVQSPEEEVEFFKGILDKVRYQLKHKGVKKILKGQREWKYLHEATNLAHNFCEVFNLPKAEGFKKFIEIAISTMRYFSYTGFSAKYEDVVTRYESIIQIEADPNQRITQELYEHYQQLANERTGTNFNYRDEPERYVKFLLIHDISKKLGLSGKQYIDAQFDMLSFGNILPLPEQLVDKKAMERAIRWMSENKVKGEVIDEEYEDLLEKIRSMTDGFDT